MNELQPLNAARVLPRSRLQRLCLAKRADYFA